MVFVSLIVGAGRRSAADDVAGPRDAELTFNFTGADWSAVLGWFTEEAGLSLQADAVPAGTFTFVDPDRSYDVGEALDVLNLSLLRRGYAVVRRGRLIQLIDLETENADKLISEIAQFVPADALEDRGRTDIVSSVFPLGGMSGEAAKDELSQLVGPWGRIVVLPSAKQVKVTETAEKLIGIREVLRRASASQTEIVEIPLTHTNAEELLTIARPLLGLGEGENTGEEIRISVGPLGQRVYATGSSSKTDVLRRLAEVADRPKGGDDPDAVDDDVLPVFETHPISIADSETVFDVLQTLVAGTPDARITIDPKTNAVVAFARPETQQLIRQTIDELEGNGRELKVYDLKRLDPAQALLTINKYFGVAEGVPGTGPTVDGNPTDGRLWVRGTREQIREVDRLLDELERDDSIGNLSEKVRVLAIDPDRAATAIDRAMMLWRLGGRSNSIRKVGPSPEGARRGLRTNRGSNGGEGENDNDGPLIDSDPPAGDARMNRGAATRLVVERGSPEETTEGSEGPAADIVVQMTETGLVVASEDPEALAEFEQLLLSLTDESLGDDGPKVFYLQHASVTPTAELISAILGGAESSLGSVVDSATSGMGGGMLGGLIGLAGGGGGDDDDATAKSVLTASGNVSLVPDARLNALFVQAGAADMRTIELLIETIDVPDSPVDVQTRAKPLLIPVIYQDAADIAKVVREIFGDRIEGNESGGGGGGGREPRNPREFFAMMRGDDDGASTEETKSEAPTIAIAVDEKTNSLLVVATPQDFEDVEALVRTLDEGGKDREEVVETVTVGGNVNGEVMKQALESLLGVDVKASSGSTGGSSSSGGGGSSSSGGSSGSNDESRRSADEIRRRIEFFRAMRRGGGFGGFDRGGGRGGFGGGGRGGERGGGRGGDRGGDR